MEVAGGRLHLASALKVHQNSIKVSQECSTGLYPATRDTESKMGTRQPVHKALLARIEKAGPVRDTENIKRDTKDVPAADPRGLKRQVSNPQYGEYGQFEIRKTFQSPKHLPTQAFVSI